MARIVMGTDDGATGEVLLSLLEAEGHAVDWVMDGFEAVETCLASPPDLVFLAASLPVFDGYTVCRRLREDTSLPATLPVVLITDAAPDPRRAEAAGFTDVLRARQPSDRVRDLLVELLGPLANAREGRA